MEIKKQYLFLISTLVFVWPTIIGVTSGDEAVERSDYYQTYNCSDAKMEYVFKAVATENDTIQTNSTIACALSCSENTDCAYAIHNSTAKTCKVVSYTTTNFSKLMTSTDENDECVVLKKIDFNKTRSCENDGAKLDTFCRCDKRFTGRYCEVENPLHCQTGQTRIMTQSDYYLMADSMIPIRIILNDSLILSMNMFGYHNTGFYLQAQHFLDMQTNLINGSSAFSLPFRWMFIMRDPDIVTSHTAKVTMDGHAQTDYDFTYTASTSMLGPQMLDPHAKVYDVYNMGASKADAIEELVQGHRMVQRELSQVKFDAANDEVSFQNIFSKVEIKDDVHVSPSLTWTQPMRYHTFEEKLGSSSRDFTFYNVLADTGTLEQGAELSSGIFETDRCWTKVDPTVDYDEFTQVLSEYAQSGVDLRVVIGGALSSDIVEIQTTGSDVIAQLPGQMVSSGTLKRSVISRTKMVADCVTRFQSPHVVDFKTEKTDSEIEWFFSTKSWQLIYSVNQTGGSENGRESDLKLAAKRDGKNVRACVHYSNSTTFVICYGNAVILMTESDDELLFQTHASFGLSYYDACNPDNGSDCDGGRGNFRGIKDSDCRQFVNIISSKGWIEEATLVLRGPAQDIVKRIDFERIDWFVDL